MYNYKTTYLLDNLASKVSALKYFNVNSTEMVVKLNEQSKRYERGIIDSVYVLGDDVFAVIKPEEELDSSGNHLPIFFNASVNVEVDKINLGEIGVKTNIRPSTDIVSSYIGKLCRVTVVNGLAIYAEVDYGAQSFTEIPAVLLRNIRASLGENSDLFSREGQDKLLNYGYTQTQIDELKKLNYSTDYKDKIITFEGEGVWQKDSTIKQHNEVILERVNIVSGLNNLGMKTKNCHIPTILFSGK